MTLLVTTFLSVSTTRLYRKFYEKQTQQELLTKARMFAVSLANTDRTPKMVDDLANRMGKQTGTRFTVIDRAGVVLGDSDEDPARLDNHSDRPEIIEARQKEFGSSIRYSESINQTLMYVAVSIDSVIVRSAIPLTLYDQQLKEFLQGNTLAIVLGFITALLLSLILTWLFSRPIEDLKQRAKLLSEGKFTAPLIRSSITEIAALSDIMEYSSETLAKRFRSISRQKERLRGVLGGMVEGVIAFDQDEKVFLFNDAARKMLSIEKENPKGSQIQELIRNVPFQQTVTELVETGEDIHTIISVPTDNDPRILNMNCRILENSRSFLIVMHDITDLKRLENLRRDFAGNVSHELRTPLTSIKGFVETLVDGAINDPDDANHFLCIIVRSIV